ncbi:hypothetical protein ACQWKR_23675, partial [Salmonella enterica subsp. enterica serovar Infantis]
VCFFFVLGVVGCVLVLFLGFVFMELKKKYVQSLYYIKFLFFFFLLVWRGFCLTFWASWVWGGRGRVVLYAALSAPMSFCLSGGVSAGA